MKRSVSVYSIETLTILSAAVLAFLLRFDFTLPDPWLPVLWVSLAVWIPVKLLSFRLAGLDRRWARYVSLTDLTRLLISNAAASLFSVIVLVLIQAGTPRSVYALDLLVCILLTAGVRIAIRMIAEAARATPSSANRRRSLIYGAGDAGTALLRDLRHQPALPWEVVGFIDDSRQKSGLFFHGVKVLGAGADLRAVAEKHQIAFVLIAVPSATGPELKAILERCNEAGIPYKTIPTLTEIMGSGSLARQIRDVAVEDLLGRKPVQLDQQQISAQLEGRVVLVTGAAGSIGSEICRQLARFNPSAIVGFEIAESPLFHLQLEMARAFPNVPFRAEIGSIQNQTRLNEVFHTHRPSVVYHAAAYKHVPLMESHVFEAVENNVFGTRNVVEAARRHDVREFVMISSDKAVRPANVMGATKRIAEILVRALQPEGASYVSVRFGNVLGSNGSVVPIFKDQIARGGPVTVTHPEMRRYFMTIPEACQLVLQASAMGRGGEIFVLDMGEPVKIVDLARNLILLSGCRPEEDIKIQFTGRRPGEKLYEELSMDEEDLAPTHHEKIKIFRAATQDHATTTADLATLARCCTARQAPEAVDLLALMVPDFTPTHTPGDANEESGPVLVGRHET